MKDLHWLPIGARIDFKILLLAFKILNDLAPYYLSSLLLRYQPARLLRSSNRLLLQVPSVIPWLMDNAHFHIRNSESVSTFKQRLKTILFSNNY